MENVTLNLGQVINEGRTEQIMEWCKQQHFAMNYENVYLIAYALIGLLAYFAFSMLQYHYQQENTDAMNLDNLRKWDFRMKVVTSIRLAMPYFSFIMLIAWILLFIWGAK